MSTLDRSIYMYNRVPATFIETVSFFQSMNSLQWKQRFIEAEELCETLTGG